MSSESAYQVDSPRSGTRIVAQRLLGAGAAAMTSANDSPYASLVETVTRNSAGNFSLVFRQRYGELLAVGQPTVISSTGGLGLTARFTAIDVDAGTATLLVEQSEDGALPAYTTGITVTSHSATLAAAGEVVYVAATTETGLFPAWTTGVTVTTNAATLAIAGEVIAVIATTATIGGPKTIINTGTPAPEEIPAWSAATAVSGHTTAEITTAGYITAVSIVAGGVTGACHLRYDAPVATFEARVVYSAAGLPTISFLAADSVTSVRFQQSLRPTLAQGQVTVTYGATGIATVTFAAADAVTACAVLVKKHGELQAIKEIIHTGTPGPGQVRVTYTAGVATLLFNTADNVTVAAALRSPNAVVADPATTDEIHFSLIVRNGTRN